jgi:hypothetical protein
MCLSRKALGVGGLPAREEWQVTDRGRRPGWRSSWSTHLGTVTPSRAGVSRTLSPFNGISHVPSAATGGTADTVCSTADSVQAGPAMVSRCA